MKREVCCPKCTRGWLQTAKLPDVVRARETVRAVEGEAAQDMACDGCNIELPTGAPCAAVSVLAPGQRDMPGWEAEYVRPVQRAAGTGRRAFVRSENEHLGQFLNVDHLVGWNRKYVCGCGFACTAPGDIYDHAATCNAGPAS